MATEDLSRLDATAQAELVRDGEATPVELVDAAIERIEAVNPEINAVITPLFEKAREAAAGELPDGPFRGVPTLLKDLLAHSAGDPFHEGMKHLRDLDWRETTDTWLVERFREAGFVICGKTNTPELGILATTEPEAHGATRNPWDTERSPGGSSGGSAAAVAAGMVPVAHGNDGGGSIRIPASACGLVGLKPSRGRVTQGPEFGDVMTGLVSEHFLARSSSRFGSDPRLHRRRRARRPLRRADAGASLCRGGGRRSRQAPHRGDEGRSWRPVRGPS